MCKCTGVERPWWANPTYTCTYLEVQDPASILDDAWHLNYGLPAGLKLGGDPIATGDVRTDLDE